MRASLRPLQEATIREREGSQAWKLPAKDFIFLFYWGGCRALVILLPSFLFWGDFVNSSQRQQRK